MSQAMQRRRPFRDVLASSGTDELLWRLHLCDPEIQRRICFELGRRRAAEGIDTLVGMLGFATPDRVRAAAVEALGRIGDSRSGARILTLFTEASLPEWLRDTAAYALGRLRYGPALMALCDALADPNPTVRECAVAALGALGGWFAFDRVRCAMQTEQNPRVLDAMKRATEAWEGGKEGAFVPLTRLLASAR